MNHDSKSVTPRKLLIIALGLASLTALLTLDLRALLSHMNAAGPTQAAIFFLVYVASAVFLVPGSILTLAAGFVFGMWAGLALTSASSTAAALVAFLTGRHLARDLVSTRLADSPRLRALDAAASESGFTVVLLTRLSPLFPYNITNYAFSLTRVGTRDYTLASWLGMLPATALYVSFGATARSLGELSTASGQTSPAKLGLLALGVLTTLSVTTILTRRARTLFAQHTESEPPAPPAGS